MTEWATTPFDVVAQIIPGGEQSRMTMGRIVGRLERSVEMAERYGLVLKGGMETFGDIDDWDLPYRKIIATPSVSEKVKLTMSGTPDLEGSIAHARLALETIGRLKGSRPAIQPLDVARAAAVSAMIDHPDAVYSVARAAGPWTPMRAHVMHRRDGVDVWTRCPRIDEIAGRGMFAPSLCVGAYMVSDATPISIEPPKVMMEHEIPDPVETMRLLGILGRS